MPSGPTKFEGYHMKKETTHMKRKPTQAKA